MPAHARAGTLPKEIEMARWRSILREDRPVSNVIWLSTIENISNFMFMCHKTITTRERFYDNETTTIHDVNLNVTDDGENRTFTT